MLTFQKLNYLTQAIQPKSQFSSSRTAHEASVARFSRAQLLRKCHIAPNPRQLRQSNPRGAVIKKKEKRERGKSNEIENGLFIESDVTYILGSKPGVNKNKQSYLKEFRRQKREQKAKKGSGPQ